MGAIWVTFSTLTNIARVFALGLNDPSTVSEWFIDEFNQTQMLVYSYIHTCIHVYIYSKCTIYKLLYTFFYSEHTDYQIIRMTFLIFSLFGFLFFDLLFVAVMVNYSSQCELLQVYIRNIKRKVLLKVYLLGDAVKVIRYFECSILVGILTFKFIITTVLLQ